MDGSRWGRSVDNAVSDVASLDNNFVATYFPWVKIATGTGVDRWATAISCNWWCLCTE